MAIRICAVGGVHFGSLDKDPALRLAMINVAGELKVPFTTGILIGIGETRGERIEALREIRKLHAAHGHIQEVIVQPFREKPNTRLAEFGEPSLEDLLWTIATARLILGPNMNIQAPPNLSPDVYPRLIEAGLNDWGGISPVTPDHVNPEAPWPTIAELARRSAEMGKHLVNRLAVYPSYVRDSETWLAPEVAKQARRMSDSEGLARDDNWAPGNTEPPPAPLVLARETDQEIVRLADRASSGQRLFAQRGVVRVVSAYMN
jgi:FO synthase